MSEVEVFMVPPAYPSGLRPFSCEHPGPMQMMTNARSVGHRIELSNPICAACGAPLAEKAGGNLLVSIMANYTAYVAIDGISSRMIYLRERYGRLAIKLFGPDGWNGRHRKWAELIDPNLTMRMRPFDTAPDGSQVWQVFHDDYPGNREEINR